MPRYENDSESDSETEQLDCETQKYWLAILGSDPMYTPEDLLDFIGENMITYSIFGTGQVRRNAAGEIVRAESEFTAFGIISDALSPPGSKSQDDKFRTLLDLGYPVLGIREHIMLARIALRIGNVACLGSILDVSRDPSVILGDRIVSFLAGKLKLLGYPFVPDAYMHGAVRYGRCGRPTG